MVVMNGKYPAFLQEPPTLPKIQRVTGETMDRYGHARAHHPRTNHIDLNGSLNQSSITVHLQNKDLPTGRPLAYPRHRGGIVLGIAVAPLAPVVHRLG